MQACISRAYTRKMQPTLDTPWLYITGMTKHTPKKLQKKDIKWNKLLSKMYNQLKENSLVEYWSTTHSVVLWTGLHDTCSQYTCIPTTCDTEFKESQINRTWTSAKTQAQTSPSTNHKDIFLSGTKIWVKKQSTQNKVSIQSEIELSVTLLLLQGL